MSKEYLLEDLDSGIEVKTEYGVCYAYSPDVVEKFRQAIHQLVSIDNANPSEALECLDRILHCNDDDYTLGYYNHDIELVKQALLKQQETKKYLTWEDLKKYNSEKRLKVKLNNVKYELHFEKWAEYDDATRISLFLSDFCVMSIRLRTNYDKQFFDNLNLEVVE